MNTLFFGLTVSFVVAAILVALAPATMLSVAVFTMCCFTGYILAQPVIAIVRALSAKPARATRR